MKCKKCNKDLSGLEYKQVAKWTFCLDCFQKFMNQAEQNQQVKNADEFETSSVTKQPLCQFCQLCNAPITKENRRELLGLLFCDACYMNLLKKPVVKMQVQDIPQSKPLVPQEKVDLTKLVHCHACHRKIPELGSKAFAGKLYCPDCYYQLDEVKADISTPLPRADAISQPVESEIAANTVLTAGQYCESCLCEVSADNLISVEGFAICRACISADSAAAIKIARARHKKRLAEMQKDLECLPEREKLHIGSSK